LLRRYFSEKDGDIVVLLCGRDKDSQDRDIEQAKIYWQKYLSNGEL
jgi:putative addiction module killer protein